MGNKKHIARQRTKKIALTLLQAEERHLLDCPTAEIGVRSAAFILDLIFFYLLTSGLESLCNTLAVHLSHLPLPLVSGENSLTNSIAMLLTKNSLRMVSYLHLVLKVSLLLFYFTWSVSFAGGTPAKLLFGIRVVDHSTGRFLDYPRAFFRETFGKLAGALLGGYGFLRALQRSDRRALHDSWTQSVVKKVHGVR